LAIAAEDDDYARVGVEHDSSDAPSRFEALLFDLHQRDRVELLSKLIGNAQQMLTERRFASERPFLESLISDLGVERDKAMDAMYLRTTVEIDEIGTRRERQLCNFYLAVANHLRARGYLRDINAASVAGTTDSAIVFDFPHIMEALHNEAPQIARIDPSDIGRLLDMAPRDAADVIAALSR